MSKVFIPAGTATGEGWQYQIERDGHFTEWRDWAIDLAFDTDPQGGDMRTGVLYWAYARNTFLPSDVVGSPEQALVASFEITESGSVVPGSPDGEVPLDYTNNLVGLIAALPDAQKLALLTLLLTPLKVSLGATTKALLCEIIATCDTTTPPVTTTFVFTNPVDYEAIPVVTEDTIDVGISDVDWEGSDADTIDIGINDNDWEGVSGNPAPIVNNPQPDQVITEAGDQHYDLNADLFSDSGDSQSLIVQKIDKTTNILSPLPTGISFAFDANSGLRQVNIGAAVPNQIFDVRVTDVDSGSNSVSSDHKLTINRGLSITKIAFYTPQGWHFGSGGTLTENVVLLVNVSGPDAANASVQAKYVQSRNDATFGSMVKIDYSNNPSPNVLPAGYTHYLLFNDETFSTGAKDFQVKIPAVSGSQKNVVWAANAATADHVTQQIFP